VSATLPIFTWRNMKQEMEDRFANFNAAKALYPMHPDFEGKSLEEIEKKLLDEFYAGLPPMRRGRRFPYALFLRERNVSIPDEENATIDPITKKKNVQHLRYRIFKLGIFDLSGSNSSESVILDYMRKCIKLLDYWIPGTNKPEMFHAGNSFYTTMRTERIKDKNTLAQFLENVKLMNPREMQSLEQKNTQLQDEKAALERKIAELTKSQGKTNGSDSNKNVKKQAADNRGKAGPDEGLPKGSQEVPTAA
jgi:hypothetical protein